MRCDIVWRKQFHTHSQKGYRRSRFLGKWEDEVFSKIVECFVEEVGVLCLTTLESDRSE